MKRLIQTSIDKPDQKWSAVTLQSIIKAPQYGYTASASDKGNARFFRITDINGFSIDWQRVPFCQCGRDQFDKYRLFENDILIARIGATTGKSCIIKRAPDAVFASYLIRVCANSKVDPDYLYYFFQSNSYWRQINENKNNNLKKGVNASILKSLKVPLPPTINEQRRIAAILSTVQRAIELQERLITLTTELKKALMHKLFTEGTRGEPQKETEIGVIPESWTIEELGSICISSSFGPRFSSDLYDQNGKIVTLRTTDMDDDGNIDFSQAPRANLEYAKFSKHFLKKHDIVISRSGTCGIAAVFEGHECPVLPGAFLIRITLKESFNPYFYRYYINSPIGRPLILQLSQGAIQKNISGSRLKRFRIPITSREEQDDIVSILNMVDRKIENHRIKRALFDDLFRTLLHQLMTAQIRVDDINLSELGIKPETLKTGETVA